MLNLTKLTKNQKFYLVFLIEKSKIFPRSFTPEILNSLKRGVLEDALNVVAARLNPKKVKFLNYLIKKIVYPEIIEGEILVPKENRLGN